MYAIWLLSVRDLWRYNLEVTTWMLQCKHTLEWLSYTACTASEFDGLGESTRYVHRTINDRNHARYKQQDLMQLGFEAWSVGIALDMEW